MNTIHPRTPGHLLIAPLRLGVLLLFCLPALADDPVRITSQYSLIPSVASPVKVEMTEQHEYYAFYLEGATSKTETGSKCTFEAPPGVRMLRVVGVDWVDGILKPTVKKESLILVVEKQASLSEDDWYSQLSDSRETPIEVAPLPEAAAVKPTKPYQGVTIEMKSSAGCQSCDRWKKYDKPKFQDKGAIVLEVEANPGELIPQFRVGYNGRRTKWRPVYLTQSEFEKHLEVLK